MSWFRRSKTVPVEPPPPAAPLAFTGEEAHNALLTLAAMYFFRNSTLTYAGLPADVQKISRKAEKASTFVILTGTETHPQEVKATMGPITITPTP